MLKKTDEIGRQLRAGVHSAMRAPTPRLRQRTLASLRDLQTAGGPTRHRSLLVATAACALFMFAVVIVAPLHFSLANLDQRVVAKPTKIELLDFSKLPRVSLPPVQVDLAKPLQRELRIIAQNAERTVDRFRDQFAIMSHWDEPSDFANRTDNTQ